LRAPDNDVGNDSIRYTPLVFNHVDSFDTIVYVASSSLFKCLIALRRTMYIGVFQQLSISSSMDTVNPMYSFNIFFVFTKQTPPINLSLKNAMSCYCCHPHSILGHHWKTEPKQPAQSLSCNSIQDHDISTA